MSRRRSFLSRPLEIDRAIRRFQAFLCKTRGGRADFLAKRNSAGKKVERARCIMYSRENFPLVSAIRHPVLRYPRLPGEERGDR